MSLKFAVEPHSDILFRFEMNFPHPDLLLHTFTWNATTKYTDTAMHPVPFLTHRIHARNPPSAIHFMWIIINGREKKKTLRFINTKLNLPVGRRVNFGNDNAFVPPKYDCCFSCCCCSYRYCCAARVQRGARAWNSVYGFNYWTSCNVFRAELWSRETYPISECIAICVWVRVWLIQTLAVNLSLRLFVHLRVQIKINNAPAHYLLPYRL